MLASEVGAEPITGLPTGIAGINPQLVPSEDGSSVYLLAASSETAVLRFDVATEQWDDTIPPLDTTGIELFRMSCYDGQCWGGPACAVGPNGTLHVVWGQRGSNDCNPASVHSTSVRLIYEHFDGTSWASPTTVVQRTAGSDECGYQYPGVADDGNGNLALIYQHASYLGGGDYAEGSFYRTRLGGGEWSSETRANDYKAPVRAAGGFGRLFVSFGESGHSHVVELSPTDGSELSEATIGSYPVGTRLVPVSATEVHAVHPHWTGEPDPPGVWHADSVHYNLLTATGWEHADSVAIASGSTIFTTPETSGEEDAIIGMSVTPAGRRLVVFGYAGKLWAVRNDGASWGAPFELETGGEVDGASAAAVGNGHHLVVWTDSLQGTPDVQWALLTADPCADCADNEICGDDGCECATPLCGGACCELGQECQAEQCVAASDAGAGGTGQGGAEPGGAGAGGTPTAQPSGTDSTEDDGCGCRLARATSRNERLGGLAVLLPLASLAARRLRLRRIPGRRR